MDLSKASADDVLQFHAGWRAARQGLPIDTHSDPYWLAGWAEEMRAAIVWQTRVATAGVANDR